MRLIIRGEVTPIERIAINEALEAHKKKYNRTGIIVNHKIKIGFHLSLPFVISAGNTIGPSCPDSSCDLEA